MKHNIFLYAVVLLACLSCSTKQKVTVEYKDYRPLNMSSFVTLQKNILLDTPTEESRIQDFHIGRLLFAQERIYVCLLYTSPSPRDRTRSRMPSSA